MSCNYPDCRSIGCDKSPKECAALHPVRSEPLLAFHIPAQLAEAFDDFVTAACAAIDCTDRRDWSDDELAIFEWMKGDKWKANAEAHGRRSRTVQPLVGASGSPKKIENSCCIT